MSEQKDRPEPTAEIIDIRNYRSGKIAGGIASDFRRLNQQIKEHIGKHKPVKIQVKGGVPFWKRPKRP